MKQKTRRDETHSLAKASDNEKCGQNLWTLKVKKCQASKFALRESHRFIKKPNKKRILRWKRSLVLVERVLEKLINPID